MHQSFATFESIVKRELLISHSHNICYINLNFVLDNLSNTLDALVLNFCICYMLNFMEYFLVLIAQDCMYCLKKNIQTLRGFFKLYLSCKFKIAIFHVHSQWLRHWIPNLEVLSSKTLGGSKVNSAFHPSEVD